ncbi:MAG: hypothetical protein H6811_09460 [Phycisphaeraceae bacterium]|nr:hypothetical protein [Phycisphaeraceae bacterium]
MTSAQIMLIGAALVCSLGACTPQKAETLDVPAVLESPYDERGGDVLFAIVPPRNESGTTTVDPLMVGDALVAAIEEARGLRSLPLNRTLDAMRELRLGSIDAPEQAGILAAALGVDGLLLGSITAYDPYDPPTIGLSLAIYKREGALDSPSSDLDTRLLTHQPTEYAYFPRSAHESSPASGVSKLYDARNHLVLGELRAFAQGRHDPTRPLGWRRYLVSMDLYTRFAAHSAVASLLDAERRRLSPETTRAP